MGDREELIKAWNIMEDENSTEREKFLAEQKEKWILDKRAIYAAGYDKGYQEGIELGRKAVAKKLKKQGAETSIIEKITELTKEEIEKL
ncbi:MAG: hypothetical protein U0L98_01025 [Clostridia bacterium]|nr:hypothetical protein [Clostridia bacterium]